ncbi:terminase gpA endonuclease subunit [Oleiharenicola lentus]|uniref:terminase gpA endonuclease subunit n=1 Tax=Oleiharenicola lentus TaxID=2508720 RepID=UPI003F662C0B
MKIEERYTPAAEKLRSFTRQFFRPAERLKPSEWCAKHIELPSGKNETKHGRVNWSYSPYLAEPLDQLDEPGVTDITFVGPTRIGKTFLLRMGVAWGIAGQPGPAMWIDSTDDKAKDISKKEIQPLIAHNKILRDRKPENRHNFTDQRMLFPAAAFTMVGGNSAAGVAGDTVKRLFGNEVDKWRGASDKEAATIELARHRTESFDDERRHMWSCTPTIEEGTIWTWFLKGDQRYYHAICPHCAHAQRLVWGQVWWDPEAQITDHKWDLERVKSSARYRCENPVCSANVGPNGWTDAERLAAIRHPDSHWRASTKGEPGHVSYHLNGLYGPLKVNRVGELAKDFLSARTSGFFHDRQDFWNSRMGEPWRENVGTITAAKFTALERPYRRGAIPTDFKADVLIVAGDVQTNRIEYTVNAANWAGDSYIVSHGEAPSWADLEFVQDTYAKLAPTSYVIIDVNFEDRRAETLEAIYERRERGWMGAEGFEIAKDLAKIERANVYLGGKLQNKGFTVPKLVISLYQFKVELEKRLSGEIKNWFTYSLDGGELSLEPPDELSKEEQQGFYAQLLDERRVPRKPAVAGKPPFVFKSRRGNNHKFDCQVYFLALLWVLRKRRVKDKGDDQRKTVTIQQG